MPMLGRKPAKWTRLPHGVPNIIHQAPHQRAGTTKHGNIAIGKTSVLVPNGMKNHGNNKNIVRGNDKNGGKSIKSAIYRRQPCITLLWGAIPVHRLLQGAIPSLCISKYCRERSPTISHAISTDAPIFL